MSCARPSPGRFSSYGSKGGECMVDYTLTVEVLEARIAPASGLSVGDQ